MVCHLANANEPKPAGILLIGPLGTNFSGIVIEIYIFFQENAFENVVWQMAAILPWPHINLNQSQTMIHFTNCFSILYLEF